MSVRAIARLLLAAAAARASVAAAGPPGGGVEGHEPADIVPPALIAQVDVAYPESALGLHADVRVLVDVDADGAVVGARIESGPEVFHAAALDAARRLRFQPATRDGAAVPVTTRVFFHFAPPVDEDEEVYEIVVHADDPDLADLRARVTLDALAVERSAGQGLAETVAAVPGVTLAAGTADNAKPIIRGHVERRLLVLFDGVRHESQKWGPDHATEIDPFAAGEISVIRGAAGARYGPDAIGGVILVTPPPMRAVSGVGGKAVLGFASNGLRPYGALRVDAATASGWSVRAEGNATRGASLRAPDYVLGNTASGVANVGLAAAYRWEAGQVRLAWRRHDLRAGVFYGVRSATPDEFRAQLEAGVPVGAEAWRVQTAIDRPYQAVTHDLVSAHAAVTVGGSTVEGTYAFQLNRRQEYEQVRGSVTGPQFDFTLRTHSLDLLLRPPDLHAGVGDLSSGLGAQAGFQENVYRGLALLPNYRSFSAGAFGFARLALARADLEVGARYDHLDRTAFLGELDYEGHVRRGTLDPERCAWTGSAARCPGAWDAASATVGGLLHLVPERLDLKLEASTASRFPNVDELYLNGTAPSFPVYGLGYPDLPTETSLGGSATAGLRLPWVDAELSAYASAVENYVYFAPELGPDGALAVDVTARGAWPRYAYRPIRAALRGADGRLALGPEAPVGAVLSGAVVRAVDAKSGAQLVGTPPDRARVELVGRPGHEVELGLAVDLVGRQSRVDPAADLAPAPPGYALLGLRAEIPLDVRGHAVRVGLEGHNLLDAAVRDYTSLLRYYADNPGRDLRVRVAADL